MLDDVDAAIARVEDDVRRAEGRAARLGSLVEAAEGVRGKATSPDRDVRVTVDQNGVLTGLYVADVAMAQSGARLAMTVLSLAAEAKADAGRQMLWAAEAILDEDDPALDTLRERFTSEDTESGDAAGDAAVGPGDDEPRLGAWAPPGRRLGSRGGEPVGVEVAWDEADPARPGGSKRSGGSGGSSEPGGRGAGGLR